MANPSLSACLAEIKANVGKFYVYILSRPDGSPFYVGVGDARGVGRQRIEFHEFDAKKKSPESNNWHKNRTILKILASGTHVGYAIDSWHFWSFEANERESVLIRKIGRADQRLGPLTNLTDGGEGSRNPTTEIRSKASARFRRLHQTEVFAARRDANIARVNCDPVLRAKTDAALREANGKPKNKARIAAQIARLNSPEGIAASTARIMALNADPEFHAKHRASRAKVMRRLLENPEFVARQRAGCARMRNNPEHGEKVRQGIQRLFKDPAKREAHIARMASQMRSRWEDPEYRAKMVEVLKARWSNPVSREALLAGRKK